MIEWAQNGNLSFIKEFVAKYHSQSLQNLLQGSLGTILMSIALNRSDRDTVKLLFQLGCPSSLFDEVSLERSGQNQEALRIYQKRLSFMDEKMEQTLIDIAAQGQIFLSGLAGKYRTMAKLALQSDDFDSFLHFVDKVWSICVLRISEECEHLFWTKGIILQKLGKYDDAFSVFGSLISGPSPLFVSFGLYELGLYNEALCCWKDALAKSDKLLCLAQGSRTLVRLRDESDNAMIVYRRLRVFAVDKYFESQNLSLLEIEFVEKVLRRMTAFLKCALPEMKVL
eukprot:TRINITY_DN18974_c0_g2_i3.p1 TRINITY_DN18974_c0_g2~~TRINITY_DN18974_c0_g2_i3.p1  ORF type:complete len:283 (-),score=65.17 TRINITY_DN18974_c0_g2_i3:46-894(-)